MSKVSAKERRVHPRINQNLPINVVATVMISLPAPWTSAASVRIAVSINMFRRLPGSASKWNFPCQKMKKRRSNAMALLSGRKTKQKADSTWRSILTGSRIRRAKRSRNISISSCRNIWWNWSSALIYRDSQQYLAIKPFLLRAFGSIDFESAELPFTYTDYYKPEFGENLTRRFVSFSRLISPAALAAIKVRTNKLEKKKAHQGKRVINIDPVTSTWQNWFSHPPKTFATVFIWTKASLQRSPSFTKKTVSRSGIGHILTTGPKNTSAYSITSEKSTRSNYETLLLGSSQIRQIRQSDHHNS